MSRRQDGPSRLVLGIVAAFVLAMAGVLGYHGTVPDGFYAVVVFMWLPFLAAFFGIMSQRAYRGVIFGAVLGYFAGSMGLIPREAMSWEAWWDWAGGRFFICVVLLGGVSSVLCAVAGALAGLAGEGLATLVRRDREQRAELTTRDERQRTDETC